MGTLHPPFASTLEGYTLAVPFATASLLLTPQLSHFGATVTVGGVAVTTGTASPSQALIPGGETILRLNVTAQDGITAKSYAIRAIREADTMAPTAAPTTDSAISSEDSALLSNPAVLGPAGGVGALALCCVAFMLCRGSGVASHKEETDDSKRSSSVELQEVEVEVVAKEEAPMTTTPSSSPAVTTSDTMSGSLPGLAPLATSQSGGPTTTRFSDADGDEL